MTEQPDFPFTSRDISSDITSQPAAPPTPPRRTPSGQPHRNRSGRKAVPTGSTSAPKSNVKSLGSSKDVYKEGVGNLLQLGAGVTLPFAPADAATILAHGENVSEAVADLAVKDERIAALLDKVLVAGPYGALLTAVVPMIAQFAVNHGMLPAGMLGTVPADDLINNVLGIGSEKTPPDSENVGGESAGHENHAAPDNVYA